MNKAAGPAARERASRRPAVVATAQPLERPDDTAAVNTPQADGRVRAVIDAVIPSVDGGRFAAKCVAGEPVPIEAHCFADGHDELRVLLHWRPEGGESSADTRNVEMQLDVNDEWHAQFTPPSPGRYAFSVSAWVDHFRSWRHELERRVDEADIRIAARVGADLVDAAAARAADDDRRALAERAARLRGAADTLGIEALKALALDATLAALADRYPDRSAQTTFPERPLVADRPRAAYSTWYELFPRSLAAKPGRHGRFADVEAHLPYVAEMGFDVLYFPPIHPIGRERRKGRNNALAAQADDVGSPWAIGAAEGGHKSILPALGTADDFRRLVAKARALDIEIALDIAFQCAPDHPYVKEHPQWFRWRPDGSVQYAENPPKKYQDIYPFNFETDDWRALWQELKSVFDHWIGEGVRIFRVDNPHTKSLMFWEWCISEIRRAHPDVLFLAEAFTRPKVMHRLAKLGFSQSYTYFTWRNTKRELIEYFTELSQGPGRHYFRPNVWPNTPDILNEHLHGTGRPAFAARLVLAATLASNYGIYGPAFELMENRPRSPGSEEYLDSEKYQLRHWDVQRADSLRGLIARVNQIRRDNPALHSDTSLRFLDVDNDRMLAYVKRTRDGRNQILTVVNLDPHSTQSSWLSVDLRLLQIEPDSEYTVHDLLSGQRFIWKGTRNFVMLDPQYAPAHILQVHRSARTERDFDAFR